MLKDGIRSLAEKYGIKLWCENQVSVMGLNFGIDEPLINAADSFKVDKQAYNVFYKKCLSRGIHMHPLRGRFYFSTAHTESDINTTLNIFETVFGEMAK
ncbi:MAG: Glutamate-1-semialdehyde 2,1-aminomutase [Bacteroidetes bacterium ADurb.Bin302]|nr:MAG: Glutamate-1-semialdehyde 2,1-aminomutase [Bacteroidetes bacterium ADurb.Bin302]